jgi:hypothetical protein
MKEFKAGKLKSGSGHKVKKRKQAIAIGLNEDRQSGIAVPESKKKKKTGSKFASGGMKSI